MKKMINITDCDEDIFRYKNEEDMQLFLEAYGCEGFEYLPLNSPESCRIPGRLVRGLHMRSFNCWLDFWKGNEEKLIREYGSWDVVEQTYGGRKREALVDFFRKDLDLAEKLGAEYVVFHISEVKIEESFTYQFSYSDEEVVDAAAELINLLLDEREYSFYFLMENLWWPGLRFTRSEITGRLLGQVHYPKKGLMLDTGHLLHTNLEIGSQQEGVTYINRMLDENQEWLGWIKGVHLQQSLTGDFVKEMMGPPIVWERGYYDRWCQIFSYIFRIDLHRPFVAPGVTGLIERISPEFLTYELISRDRQEHERLLAEQIGIFQTEKKSF